MEKRREKSKKFTSRMQASLLLVFCAIVVLLAALMVRLVYIVQTDGDKYAKQVLSKQTYISSVLPFKRGDIVDCNGTVLATSSLEYKLILDPKLLLEDEDCIKPTINALEKNFSISADTIKGILKDKADSQYIILLKNLKYDKVQKFKAKQKKNSKINGIWFEEYYVRSYPYKTLACDVIGFSNTYNQGYYGIEEYYNEVLNGTNGREYGYYDSELDIDHIVKNAVDGNSVITTINADVQRIIQENMIKFNKKYGSEGIGMLVMNPNDGSVIAMAYNKEYDLNNPSSLTGIYSDKKIAAMSEKKKTKTLQELWKNDVISHNFEPGSTFKPVTVAAALEENLVSDKSTFFCDGGETKGGTYIKCSHHHGLLTLGETIEYSCNDAMMQIAELEGKNIFYKYETDFGFGQKTGIDLPGEEAGQLIEKSMLRKNSSYLATSSFGQSTTATMIQVAAMFSSVVNGGYYYQPHVMQSIVNDNGATVREYDKVLVRKTISEQTSKLLQKYLYRTVEEGTGTGAKVKGYTIGGKTGTAETIPRGTDDRVVSFIGCSPAINPTVVLYVVIDTPKNVPKQSAGYATELAGEVFNKILPVLGVYPDGDINYGIPTSTPTPTQTASKNKKSKKTDERVVKDKSSFKEE